MNTLPGIRFAELNDLPALVDIYNQAIRSKNSTGDLEEYKVEDRISWFNKYNKDSYPIYVLEINKKVVGYCYLSPYRPGRKAMLSVAEITYYLDDAFQGKGIGTLLLKHVMEDCERLGKKSLLAILLDINPRSVNILKKLGFEKWGHFPSIVNMDGKLCSQIIYGLKIPN